MADKPVVVIFMCSDERFDGYDGRMTQLKQIYEAQGYKVYFVRIAATSNWLADAEAGPHLMSMNRAFLLQASLILVEAHMTCVGVRDKFAQRGEEWRDEDEHEVHTEDLDAAVTALMDYLRVLGHTGLEIRTTLNLMNMVVGRGSIRI